MNMRNVLLVLSILALGGAAAAETIFDDDESFRRIEAVEAAGEDALAHELWQRWHLDYPESPLFVEADLAAAWNLLRGGDVAGAGAVIDTLQSSSGWLVTDSRLLVLQAAVACTETRYDSALGRLAGARQAGLLPPVGLMIEALCLQALGREYDAVVTWQELLDEHEDSPLRGHAFMAKGRILDSDDSFLAAADEFEIAARRSPRVDHRGHAEYMAAAGRFLGGEEQAGLIAMHAVTVDHAGGDLAARALFSLGEMRWRQGRYDLAIVRFNEVLSLYFAHDLAGSALYRTGRCLDAQGRTDEAIASYRAVAEGHPFAPEAPAAVYLAGVGLFEAGDYLEAASFFQLVLDRYAGTGSVFVFESPEHQELVEASLCLLEYSYYQAGETGLMAGAPHLALQKMPPSRSMWRAWTLLLDADALAAVDRFAESQTTLATLFAEFPDDPVGIRANRLLAWTYAKQGREDLAIETERGMLARFSAQEDRPNLAAALLTIANSHFNAKRYDEAAAGYRDYVQRFGDQGHKLAALYQEGLCYVRLGRAGDAVDRWALITSEAPAGEQARKAWLRSGDLLFQAGRYGEARRQYTSMMEHFTDDNARAAATLRLGRCGINEGDGDSALALFREVTAKYPGSREAAEAAEGITHILYTLGREGDDEALRELFAHHPDSPLAPEAGFLLALRAYEADDFDGAAARFETLCGSYPRYSAADRFFFYAADSRERAGDGEAARSGWADFMRHFPGSELAPSALLHLANLRFNDGLYHQAVADFDRILAMPAEDEIHAAALLNLAASHRILGHRDEALATLEDFRARGSADQVRDVAVARSLGELHQEMGHLKEASRNYHLAIELGAEPAEAVELHYLAGLCLKEAGDLEGALGAYAESIASADKSNSFRLSALAHSADLHERSGDFDEALVAYRDLIENAPDPSLADAARDRVTQLETALGH